MTHSNLNYSKLVSSHKHNNVWMASVKKSTTKRQFNRSTRTWPNDSRAQGQGLERQFTSLEHLSLQRTQVWLSALKCSSQLLVPLGNLTPSAVLKRTLHIHDIDLCKHSYKHTYFFKKKSLNITQMSIPVSTVSH